jgi:hypothetical protein
LRWHVPPKCWALWKLHSVTTQDTAFFIVTTMGTSTPTPILTYNIQCGTVMKTILVGLYRSYNKIAS